MREFHVGANDAGQRLDRFLSKAIPALPASLTQKYIRLKRIKVNASRAQRDQRLAEGDCVSCYIGDEFFEVSDKDVSYRLITEPKLSVVYEDENIMLLDKPVGMVVHADETERVHTLVNHMLAYLVRKGEWNPADENAFTPALCNRIDRNTGGLVIAAKNAEALRIMSEKIRDRELSKYYLCVCIGTPDPPKGRLSFFLRKDEKENLVRVYRHPVPGGRSAETLYETLAVRGGYSLVEAELLTGRTHQIRASFAAAGHPLLGDGKYGSGAHNRRSGEAHQLLYSYRLRFDFLTDAGMLNYLKGKEFIVDEVPFQKKYFSETGGKKR